MDHLHAEPDPIMRQSNRLLDAAHDARSAHSDHHDELESAFSGMFGEASKAALQAAHAELVDKARTLHHQLGEHGRGMQEFVGQLVETDERGKAGFRRTQGQ